MKNALILDGSFSIEPLYRNLCKNYKVFTIGSDRESFYKKKNINHFFIDYSKVLLVKKYIKTNNIEFIIPGCTDQSLKTFGELDLRYKKSISETLSKNNLDLFCKKHKINHPKKININKEKEFPLIVKPDYSYSGRGVSIVYSTNGLLKAIKSAYFHSLNKRVIIQEYIIGQLYSSSIFLREDGTFEKIVVKEFCNIHKFSVDESYVISLTEDLDFILNNLIKTIFLGLDKVIKFFHIQFIIRDKEIFLIEVFLRCPGDLYNRLIELSTGINYGAKYIAGFSKDLGDDNFGDDKISIKNYKKIKRITFKISPGEIVNDIKLPRNAVEYISTLSFKTKNSSDLPLRFGILFLEVKDLRHNPYDVEYKK